MIEGALVSFAQHALVEADEGHNTQKGMHRERCIERDEFSPEDAASSPSGPVVALSLAGERAGCRPLSPGRGWEQVRMGKAEITTG